MSIYAHNQKTSPKSYHSPTMSNNLNWSEHVRQVSAKTLKYVRRVFRTEGKSARTLNDDIVLPVMENFSLTTRRFILCRLGETDSASTQIDLQVPILPVTPLTL